MATPSTLDTYDQHARIQELYLALNGNDAKASQEAMRELSGMGFNVEQDPTGSTYVVSPGQNSLRPPQGAISQRPATPVGAPGFGSELQYHHRTPRVGLLSSTPPASQSAAAAAARGAVLGAVAAPKAPAAPAAPVTPGVVAAVPAGRSAFSMGAPAMDDRVDGFGRPVPGTQSFVRGLFATADNANKALVAYKKQNPNANSQNDPQHRALEQAVSSAVGDSNAGSKWASMTPSVRQSVLTQGELASGRARATDMIKQGAVEQNSAEFDRLMSPGGPRATNLLEDGQYFRDTGVMRGGAGVGTSTTPAGGVIAPAKGGGLALTSPYGTGRSTLLTPEQQAMRPEAKIEKMPASQYFDKAAMRQGQSFDVGGKHYSPALSPEDFKQKQLEEAKRKAAEARKNFAASILKR